MELVAEIVDQRVPPDVYRAIKILPRVQGPIRAILAPFGVALPPVPDLPPSPAALKQFIAAELATRPAEEIRAYLETAQSAVSLWLEEYAASHSHPEPQPEPTPEESPTSGDSPSEAPAAATIE